MCFAYVTVFLLSLSSATQMLSLGKRVQAHPSGDVYKRQVMICDFKVQFSGILLFAFRSAIQYLLYLEQASVGLQ